MKHNTMSVYTALNWLGRMAVADGVLSPNEVEVLRNFSDCFGINIERFLITLQEEAERREKEVEMIDIKDKRHQRGRLFEDFVISKLIKRPALNLISRSSDTEANKFFLFDDRSKKPDLFVQMNSGLFGHKFWIECKYSQNFTLSIRKKQLERFRKPQVRGIAPVFFILGLGGEPDCPAKIFLVSLESILSGKITKETKDGERIFVRKELLPYFEIKPKDFTEAIKKFM